MIVKEFDDNESGIKRFTSPCTLLVLGDFGGGTLTILVASGQIAEDDLVDGDFALFRTLDDTSTELAFNVAGYGPYWVKAVLAGATTPALTVKTL